MKNIVYLSKTKLDMYWQQIPRAFLDGANAKLKVDLGVLSAELGASAITATSEFERLSKLVEFLDAGGHVGSAADRKPFLRGTFTASALFHPPRVFLRGALEQSNDLAVTLCLCGSAKHFIGYDPKVDEDESNRNARIGSVEAQVFHFNSNSVAFYEFLNDLNGAVRHLAEAEVPIDHTFTPEDLLPKDERKAFNRLRFMNPAIARLYPSRLRSESDLFFDFKELGISLLLGPLQALLFGVGGVNRKLKAMKKLAIHEAYEGVPLSKAEQDLLSTAAAVGSTARFQQYEFVARRLLQGATRSGGKVILASPLYLATVDQFSPDRLGR